MARAWHGWRGLARDESRLLVGLAAIAGAAWLFAALAGEVMEGETGAFDRWVLLALRNPVDLSDPLGPPWLEEAMRDISALGSNAVLGLITAAVVGFLLMLRRRREAALLVASVALGALLDSLLKLGFDRQRPDLVPQATRVFTASFPSGHSMMSAVVYLTLGALVARFQPSRRIRIYMLSLAAALSIIVGISRVYLGVHWPTDVLGGWTVGAAWALLCWLVALPLQRRGAIGRMADEKDEA